MELFYHAICFLNKMLGKIWLRMHVRLVGITKLPYGGPLIIAPNHASYLDPSMLAGTWWPHVLDFFASKHLYDRSRILSWLLLHLRTHPLARENGLQALRQALRFLQEKKTIVLFPEGTRSRSGTMGGLKKGIAMLSAKAQCPVVPVFITGTYDAWPPNKKFPRLFNKQRVCFYVGKPLPPCPEDSYEEWLQKLKKAYEELEQLANSDQKR